MFSHLNFCFFLNFWSYPFTGSADRTVKFWDLETFELIGSAGPEVSCVFWISLLALDYMSLSLSVAFSFDVDIYCLTSSLLFYSRLLECVVWLSILMEKPYSVGCMKV